MQGSIPGDVHAALQGDCDDVGFARVEGALRYGLCREASLDDPHGICEPAEEEGRVWTSAHGELTGLLDGEPVQDGVPLRVQRQDADGGRGLLQRGVGDSKGDRVLDVLGEVLGWADPKGEHVGGGVPDSLVLGVVEGFAEEEVVRGCGFQGHNHHPWVV